MKPICPYCNAEAEFVTGKVIYPHLPDLAEKKFWLCAPCKAYVGCHKAGIGYGDGTRPLGRLADARLRAAKLKTHNIFDRLWMGQKDRRGARTEAYAELAKRMGIPVNQCHIGEFDVDQCEQAQLHANNMINTWGRWNKR